MIDKDGSFGEIVNCLEGVVDMMKSEILSKVIYAWFDFNDYSNEYQPER